MSLLLTLNFIFKQQVEKNNGRERQREGERSKPTSKDFAQVSVWVGEDILAGGGGGREGGD